MPQEQSAFHPHYNPGAFGQYAAKIKHFEQLGDKIALYPPHQRGKAQRKHERILDKEFGSVSSDEYDFRLRLFEMWFGMHLYWQQDGKFVTDASTVFDELESICLRDQVVAPKEPGCPSVYIHLGHHERLALKSFDGFVEGVYVKPPRKEDAAVKEEAIPMSFMMSFPSAAACLATGTVLGAVCRRGGKLLPNASLEKLILNQSSTVFSRVLDGQLDVIIGDGDMMSDPAVALAMRVAMEAYAGTIMQLASFQTSAA